MNVFSRIATIMAIVSASFCAQAQPNPSAPFKGEGGKVRVLSFFSGNYYPMYVIAKMQLDRKYGFELENVNVQPGGAVMTAFRSGSVEGGLMNWLEVARARTNGDDVSAVVPLLEMPNVWVVPANSPIRTVADLKQKTVGTYNRFGPEWLLYLATAKSRLGYDPRAESTIQEAGPGLLRGLLDQKQLDASFIFYNLAFPMVATGNYRILFTSRELLQTMGLERGIMLTSIAFRGEYIKSNPKNVRAFALAYQEAVRLLRGNDEIWTEMLATQDIKDPAVVKLMRDYTREVTMERFSSDPMDETRKLFAALHAVAGKDALGIDTLPAGMFSKSFAD